MDKNAVLNAVDEFYRIRLENDPEKTLQLFAENAEIRVAGAEDVSEIAHSATGRDGIESSVRTLLGTWTWDEVERLSTLVDENRAVARYLVIAEHAPSGRTTKSESLDEFAFDESLKIVELIEFVDTALTERIVRG